MQEKRDRAMTKELLSEVLGENVETILVGNTSLDPERNRVVYTIVQKRESTTKRAKSISIYELAHKYKEWAYNNGYEIESLITSLVRQVDNEATGEEPQFCSTKKSLSRVININSNSRKVIKHYYAETEPEAIFKTCEYILEQKEIEL